MLEKIKRIIELAYLINPTKTSRDITGKKPSITVNFSGANGNLDVHQYIGGFDFSRKTGVEQLSENIKNHENLLYLDFSDTNAMEQLDKCISKLEELYEKWGKNETV